MGPSEHMEEFLELCINTTLGHAQQRSSRQGRKKQIKEKMGQVEHSDRGDNRKEERQIKIKSTYMIPQGWNPTAIPPPIPRVAKVSIM